ncbi:16488_t:CDS:1, partial [Dentiscutata heterogama]
KELAKRMCKKAKKVDKTPQHVSYCTSSVLRPLDNTICIIYRTKLDLQNIQALET